MERQYLSILLVTCLAVLTDGLTVTQTRPAPEEKPTERSMTAVEDWQRTGSEKEVGNDVKPTDGAQAAVVGEEDTDEVKTTVSVSGELRNTVKTENRTVVDDEAEGENGVEERKLKRQVKQLQKKMKCRPQRVKARVKDYLNPSDGLLDRPLLPQVVVVRRCQAEFSYCGDGRGNETGTCRATKWKHKKFTVSWESEDRVKSYATVRIRNDRKCACVDHSPRHYWVP